MQDGNKEAELESFRKQWREEVTGQSRTDQSAGARRQVATSSSGSKAEPSAPPPASRLSELALEDDIYDGGVFDDLDDQEELLKLANANIRPSTTAKKEPTSALEHYEKAVERETQGSLGDSVSHYRKAFKAAFFIGAKHEYLQLDSKVQETYKKKHFPGPAPGARPSTAAGAIAPASSVASSSKQSAPESSKNSASLSKPAQPVITPGINELLDEFSQLSILAAEPETSLSPQRPCPVAEVPEEILVEILLLAAITDVANVLRIALVCRRFAYLIMTEDRIWKQLSRSADFGFRGMHYRYACGITSGPLKNELYPHQVNKTAPARLDLTPLVYPTYRTQYRNRPRIRFNGCYISTVNYTRPGGASQSQFTWSSPIHIVTYYRYLRFFRDGRVISLLTTAEPADVVHHLTLENIHVVHASALTSAALKDALRGRWRLSGTNLDSMSAKQGNEGSSPDPPADERPRGPPGEYSREPYPIGDISPYTGEEAEGDVHIETEGVSPKYYWKMQFSLGNSGKKESIRNNKLNWKGFWSFDRITHDWGEFRMKNERGFYFSRVKSYGNG